MTPVHQNIVLKAQIKSKTSGTATFLDGKSILGKSEVRASEFQKYQDGTIVECHYRVAENRKQLLFVRPVDAKEELVGSLGLIEEETNPEELIPQWMQGHYVEDNARYILGVALNTINEGGIFNLLVRGASGYGKTSLFESLSIEQSMNFLRMNCALMMDTEQWFGNQEARDGSTLFIQSDFTDAIEAGNVVIVLDEANRIEPWLSNSLFPILDHQRAVTVRGRHIRVAPRTIFALTINEGVKFAGTHMLDAAFLNRMDAILEVGPLPRVAEVKLLVERVGVSKIVAESIVEIAKQLRAIVEKDKLDIDVSTRTSLKVAKLVKNGAVIKRAYEFVVTNSAEKHEQKAIIDCINGTLK